MKKKYEKNVIHADFKAKKKVSPVPVREDRTHEEEKSESIAGRTPHPGTKRSQAV